MQKKMNLTILFADIVGSTRLYEQLGNDKARTVTSACLDLVSAVISEKDGTLVKTIGDEVMAVFPAADKAADAAVAIQERMTIAALSSSCSLQMKIGFHAGEVICEENDVFGDAVNIAARMAAQAKAEQIITTRETLDTLSPCWQTYGRQLKETRIHGKDELIQICELTWGDVSALTVMSNGAGFRDISPEGDSVLFLSFPGGETVVSRENPLLTLGRGEDNSVCLANLMVSRRHARVEWRTSGEFFLVDQSTNGIYLQREGREKCFIHREETQLLTSGVFWLSGSSSPAPDATVHYRVKR